MVAIFPYPVQSFLIYRRGSRHEDVFIVGSRISNQPSLSFALSGVVFPPLPPDSLRAQVSSS